MLNILIFQLLNFYWKFIKKFSFSLSILWYIPYVSIAILPPSPLSPFLSHRIIYIFLKTVFNREQSILDVNFRNHLNIIELDFFSLSFKKFSLLPRNHGYEWKLPFKLILFPKYINKLLLFLCKLVLFLNQRFSTSSLNR